MRAYIYIMEKQTTVTVKNQNGTLGEAVIVRGNTRDDAHETALALTEGFLANRPRQYPRWVSAQTGVILAEVDES